MTEIKPLKRTREHNFLAPGFQIKSGRTKTLVYTQQELDLVVHQISPEGKESYLSHYSSPGFDFYASIIKFLHENKQPLPKLPKAKWGAGSGNAKNTSDLDRGISFVAKYSEKTPFPFQYQYGLHGINSTVSRVELPKQATLPFKPAIKTILEPHEQPSRLEFTTVEGNKIFIDIPTAKALARKIPELYPHLDGFRLIAEHYAKLKR